MNTEACNVRATDYNGRSLGGVVREISDEVKEFLDTRYQMLRSEISEKVSVMKTAVPMLVVAAVFAWVAFLVITYCLVALIAGFLLPSPYAWVIGAAIIGVLYAIIAGALFWFGYKEIKSTGMAPTRTMNVLKQDQVWLQTEARSA